MSRIIQWVTHEIDIRSWFFRIQYLYRRALDDT